MTDHTDLCKRLRDLEYLHTNAVCPELREEAAEAIERLEAYNAALRTRAIKAECVLQVLLEEVSVTMHHAETFIISLEKMHPDGVTLYQELLGKIDAALLAGEEKQP